MQDKANTIAMLIGEADDADIRYETRDLCLCVAELAGHVSRLERKVRDLENAVDSVRRGP